MKVLVIDIGGNSVKLLVTGKTDPRKFPSGPKLTPRLMVPRCWTRTEDWKMTRCRSVTRGVFATTGRSWSR